MLRVLGLTFGQYITKYNDPKLLKFSLEIFQNASFVGTTPT